jgi:quinol---cytochrome-c reductase cytochrome b subunit
MAKTPMTNRLVRWLDRRVGGARLARKTLDKVFPDHWSFLLGEVSLYCFIVLVLTGIYLSLFFSPSQATVTYAGSYAPLRGVEMSQAYESAIRISFDVRAGMVMRQIHHWAALVFIAAITAHLARIFFTGAFRRPRELNWVIGVTLLVLAMINGFAGYSLLDDQLSGTGLRIANAIILSVPLVGTWVSSLLFGGPYPGPETLNRLFVAHILLVPALIGVLIAVHLALVVRHKHTQYPGPGKREDNVVGQRLWPTYTAKAGGLFFLVASVLAALGGLAQINAIWVTGPYRQADVSSASQPDWYMGWTEGGLRLMPPFEIRAYGFQIPNPFFPGVLLPTVVFGILYIWPFIEQRVSTTTGEHHLLFRPRDHPVHTGIGVAAFAFIAVMLLAGSSDVIAVTFGISVNAVIWTLRTALLVVPPVAGLIAGRLCVELRDRDRNRPPPATEPPEPAAPASGEAVAREPAAEPAPELSTGVARATTDPPDAGRRPGAGLPPRP